MRMRVVCVCGCWVVMRMVIVCGCGWFANENDYCLQMVVVMVVRMRMIIVCVSWVRIIAK